MDDSIHRKARRRSRRDLIRKLETSSCDRRISGWKAVLLSCSRGHKYRGHSPRADFVFQGCVHTSVIGYFHSSLSREILPRNGSLPLTSPPSHKMHCRYPVVITEEGRKARDELKALMRVKVSRSMRIDNLHRISQGACVFDGIPLIN